VGDSLDTDRAENVTAERPGASRWPAAAFRSAGFSSVLRRWCTEREAIDTSWNGGAWRERTAGYAAAPLALADRLPGEAATADGDGAVSPGAGPAPAPPGRRSRQPRPGRPRPAR